MEVHVKAFCMLLLGLDTAVLVASYFKAENWSYEVCRNAFGLCENPLVVALSLLACVGMYITLKEVG